ncbi:MAG: hypothetical protein M3Q96_01405, partial [Pseudomonadota bacterium]|nr:hypothetical protein [Pseudomonadota bacterium]
MGKSPWVWDAFSVPSARRSGAARHQFDLPEVTFDACAIATRAISPQHRAMPAFLRTLLQPMNLAALVTWMAVALGLQAEDVTYRPLMWLLLAGYLSALLACDFIPLHRRQPGLAALMAIEATCALALVWLAPRGGTAPVLLVVLVAQLA